MNFTPYKQRCFLWLAVVNALFVSVCIGDGVYDESTTRYFTNFADQYSFSASAYPNWKITSASTSGGGSGSWSASINGDHGGNSSTATGDRASGFGSSEMFSVSLYGSIVPLGPGKHSATYSYSVSAAFKGSISVTPSSQITSLWGGVPESYRLLSTYDGVPHHIGGYWRTMPNRGGDNFTTDYTRHWASYYGGDTRWPGVLTVEGSAHSDGGDSDSAELRVVGVLSVTATPSSGSPETSSTDGIKRNPYMEPEKDENGNNIPEEIPTVYSKQARALTLTATPDPPGSWPSYGVPPLSYPTWSITGISNNGDYLSSLNGASSSIKTEKAFGGMQINASCGNNKKINAKYIRVKFGKSSVYANWNIHGTLNVTQFLAGNSSFTGCANPATCTDLDCNHRGCYDQNNFAWSVAGDAQLKLSKADGTTVYEQNFSPAAEAAKTEPEQRLSFTGNIRFTKPSLTTTADITITATSEELTSETDTLTVIPQYINLVVANVEEETYDPETGNINNSDKNEGSIGAFVSINDNDSNDDKNADREKNTEASGSDSDLLAVTLSKQISGPIDADHPVTLSLSAIYPATSSSMKVWKDASRSELYLSSSGTKQFTSASNLGPFYIEAVGSTSGVLSVSYTYPNGTTNPNPNNDYSSTNYYIIDSCGDNIRLNGFGVDIKLAGLDDERTITDSSNPPNTVRVLPFEIFPGGELEVKPDVDTTLDENNQVAIANGILTSAELKGSNLTETQTVTVSVTSGSDKIKLYEPVMVEDVHQVNASGVPLYNVFTGTGLNVSDLPKTIYILPIKDSASKRDVQLKMSYTSSQNEATHEDIVKLTCLMLDLDVDSNNDGTIAVDDVTEDTTELYAPITVNADDKDGDSIPDNVDYHIFSSNYSENIFKEMVVRIPTSIDLDNCKIKVSYGNAVPPLTEGGTLDADGDHSLRVWKKRSNEIRDPKPIGGTHQTGDIGGDYVMPTNWTVEEGQDAYYTPEQLLGTDSRQGSFWVESVCEANGYNAQITFTILPIESRTVNAETVIPDDEATVPETYNLSDTVGFSTLGISLHFPDPIPATPAAGTTPASRGYDTILVTNIADESADGKRPDYANFSERSGETSLLQLNMTVSSGNVAKNNLKIKFEYNGVDSLDSITETSISDAALKDIFMRGNKQYFDYTPFKKGMMRVWASSKPVQDAGGTWNSALTISTTSARDRASYMDEGNYFMPATSVDDAYSLSDLFPDSNGPNYSMSFQVEGINPAEKVPVKAILLYNNGSSWQEVAASFVNVKVIEAKVILNVNNDKTYELDDDDHKLKDQHDGFQGWYASEFNSATFEDATSTHGFENLFPIRLKNLPALPENMKYELQINHNGVVIPNPESGGSRLSYLKSASLVSGLESALLAGGTSHSILQHDALTDLEFLFGIYQTGTIANNRVSLALYPDIANAPTSSIVLDECLYTFRPVDKYFWMGSCRAEEANASNYDNDPGKNTSSLIQYEAVSPYSGWNNITTTDCIDTGEPYFIFLHGFNVSPADALNTNRIVFRRLHWTGYRDNYIGITWNGNQASDWIWNYFDHNMENALLSGKAVSSFVASLPGGAVQKNIVAHSLGNLVMWDALRQHWRGHQSKLVNYAISIEAAVWEESFWGQNSIDYQKQNYTIQQWFNPDTGMMEAIEVPDGDPIAITYFVDDLINNSWTFWLNQGGNAEWTAKKATNHSINSYADGDEYLNGSSAFSMKRNDFYSSKDYYLRNSTVRRDPTTLPDKAAMFKLGKVVRKGLLIPLDDFTDPAGVAPRSYFSQQVKAQDKGWSASGHADFKDVELYKIVDWYNETFVTIK